MKRAKVWGLVIAGVLLPAVLAMGAFTIASGLDTPARSPALVNRQIEKQAKHSDDRAGDRSGRCAEAEHLNDPSCASTSASPTPTPTATVDDKGGSSGKGSPDSSGKGSDDDHPTGGSSPTPGGNDDAVA